MSKLSHTFQKLRKSVDHENREIEKSSNSRTPEPVDSPYYNTISTPTSSEKKQKRKSLTNIFSGDVFGVFKGLRVLESNSFTIENDLLFEPTKLETKMSIRNMVLSNSLEQQFKAQGNIDVNNEDNTFKSRWVEIIGQTLHIFNKKQGKEKLSYLLNDFSIEVIGEKSITHYKEKDHVTGHVFSIQLPDLKLTFSLATKEEFKSWIESFYIIELKNFATVIEKDVITKRDQVEMKINDQYKILMEDNSLEEIYGKKRYKELTKMYEQKIEEIKGL